MIQTFDIEKIERFLVSMQMKCMFKNLKGIDLHPGQMHFLQLLAHSGKCKQTEIAEKMHVSCASVGVSVRRLLKIGLVKKTAVENDLRATNIELTEKGRMVAKQVEQTGQALLRVKYDGITERQLQDYYSIQCKIAQNVKQYYEQMEGENLERTR